MRIGRRESKQRGGDALTLAVEAWRARCTALERELALSHAREAELTAQIRMVMEERFYHPVVTGREAAQPAAPSEGAVPPAAAFEAPYADEDALRKELEDIVKEHEEWRERRKADAVA